MAGPLFRELAEGLAPHFVGGCLLYTGHPDTILKKNNIQNNLIIKKTPAYDRRTYLHRILSWINYLVVVSHSIVTAKSTDCFLLVSNPPILGAWFWLLNKIRRRPYMVLVYDIHPDVLVEMGILKHNGLIARLWYWINKKVYRDAALVVTLGKRMSKRLKRQFSDCNTEVKVIPPWVDVNWIQPIMYNENKLSKELNPYNKKIILYSGNMGVSHDIDSILAAATLLSDRDDILFTFIGGGEKWLDVNERVSKNEFTNVQVYPYQPEELLPYSMGLSTISIVTLEKGAEELMIPSKVFYYMATGSAIVGICNGYNELRDIVESNDCGVCVPSNQPESLANAIESILGDSDRLLKYRNNARQAAIKYYSSNAGVEQFTHELQNINFIPQNTDIAN